MENKKLKNYMKVFTLTAALAVICVPSMAVSAATGGQILATSAISTSFNSLETLVESVVSGIGTIVTLWGISEWGIAFQGSEGTMQANAFKRIAGGLVMMLAPQLLSVLSATV